MGWLGISPMWVNAGCSYLNAKSVMIMIWQ